MENPLYQFAPDGTCLIETLGYRRDEGYRYLNLQLARLQRSVQALEFKVDLVLKGQGRPWSYRTRTRSTLEMTLKDEWGLHGQCVYKKGSKGIKPRVNFRPMLFEIHKFPLIPPQIIGN